jgi:hypothetical protein
MSDPDELSTIDALKEKQFQLMQEVWQTIETFAQRIVADSIISRQEAGDLRGSEIRRTIAKFAFQGMHTSRRNVLEQFDINSTAWIKILHAERAKADKIQEDRENLQTPV